MKFLKSECQVKRLEDKKTMLILGAGILVICILLAVRLQNSAQGVSAKPEETSKQVEDTQKDDSTSQRASEKKNDYIKWVDFNVTCQALIDAYEWDVKTHGQQVELNWITLLAYLACRNGGDFGKYKSSDMDTIAEVLVNQENTLEEMTQEKKYYNYYLEAYTAVLGGMVGEYEIETDDGSGGKTWEKRYGLKAFSPIAKGYEYYDYDDFGSPRAYGYSRPHLGHDMMGQIGTPVIAIETGYVEALGWNQYGGWRIGIRSLDKKRYYYYAHLRQNFPYHLTLKEGSIVQAGDVIGYMGHTGYSATENVNNIKTVHLHWGLQLIFDESQKDGNNEIWVDCYQLTRFLAKNRSETSKNLETKDYYRIYEIKDPAVKQ